MISSLLISQMIDERRLQKDAPALPGQCMMVQPQIHPMNQSLPGPSPANLDQAFSLLPGRMGITMSSKDTVSGATLLPQEENQDPNPKRGFSSITITARRVVPPTNTLMWGTTVDPLCSTCGAKDGLRDKMTLGNDREPRRPHTLFGGHEGSANRSVSPFKASDSHRQLCWILNPENKENMMIPPAIPSHGEKVPLLFSSCVHLRVSQPCANTVHYLDRSLSIPLDRPPITNSKLHRSVLSLNLNCSSHGITPDGVDRMANTEGEDMGDNPLSQKLAEQRENRSPTTWAPDFKDRCLRESPPWQRIPSRNYSCSWSSTPSLGNQEFSDTGKETNHLTVGKMKGESMALYHTISHPNKLSIHIPGWSYVAGDYRCCDLVVKLKACRNPGEEGGMTPEAPEAPTARAAPATPAAPSEPMSPEKPEPPPEQEAHLEPEIGVCPTHSLTLREALEVHKPQFISRSQERLRKLESMAQQRKAQRGESPRKKPNPLPLRTTKKKQYTIPHPLSDNLFKPKERCISEKEMHMRSKRIYNNLPEVKKKKEEQKKRVILQSNRLRAEVFKKQLLDQILQRSAD